jgi:hypothetical protein
MKNILFLALLISVAYSAIVKRYVDEQGRPIEQHVDSYLAKGADDVMYRITYDAEILAGNFITSLDDLSGIDKVLCDMNDIEMIIDFHSIPEAYELYNKIKDEGYEKYVTSLKYNCSNSKTKPFVNLKEILAVELNQNTVLIRTALGTYERLFKQASVRVDPIPDSEGYEKTLCFGVNANEDCTAAYAPLQLYQNKYIDISCSNCFFGTKATAFFDFKISSFKLRHIGAGFKGISINAAFVLDMVAQAPASGGIDRVYTAAAGVVLQFYIGPVPIIVTYQIPIRVLAEAMIELKAFAKVGALATWKLGDAYVEWDEHTGWKKGEIKPSFNWNHVLDGDAAIKAGASLSIIPSVELSLLNIINAGVTLTPAIRAAAEGNLKEKQLCVDVFYRAAAELYALINMNIPLVKAANWKFGPVSLFDTGEKQLGHWCIRKEKEAIA